MGGVSSQDQTAETEVLRSTKPAVSSRWDVGSHRNGGGVWTDRWDGYLSRLGRHDPFPLYCASALRWGNRHVPV